MKYDDHRHNSGGSLWQLLLTVGGVLLLIIYAVGALNTGNWLWFSPVQPDYEPSRILVRQRGQSIAYGPEDPGFATLAAALDAGLADFSNSDLVPLGLSEETLQEYSETAVVIEVFYPQDIRFNSRVRMRNVNQLLIPIEGRHAGNRYAFLGSDGRWLAGAMTMTDDSALLQAMRDLGHIE